MTKRALQYIGYAILCVSALAALGALMPTIPVLGSLGPLLVSPFGSWIVIIALIGAIASGVRWWRMRRRVPFVMMLLGGFAALGAGIVERRQISIARANGIPIDLLQTVWAGSIAHGSAPPVVAQYGSNGRDPLDVAIYRPAAARNSGTAPILVYVHGGGWGAGTIHDREADMRWFADRGYLVVSVGYTLSTKDIHAWNLSERQVGCALVWIGGNAAQLGGDPARIALFGESAGGNLVVNVAYEVAAGRLQPTCPGAVPRIGAVVAPYPVLDAVRMFRNDDLLARQFAPTMTTHYIGGTPEQFPDRYAAISSASHIVHGSPPTLLFPGMADHLLPVDGAFDFASKARAAGIHIRVIAVPYAEHSFDQGSGSVGNQIVRNGSLLFLSQLGLAARP